MKKVIITVVLAFALVTTTSAASLKSSTLRVGSTGETVKAVQQKLLDLGYSTSKVDGKYGRKTAEAVAKFQAAQKLKSDGLAGEKTLALILKSEPAGGVSGDSFIKTTGTLPGVPTVPVSEPGSEIDWRNLCRDGKPHIQVLSPNGDEIYSSNQQIPVTWKTCNTASGSLVHLSIRTYQNGTAVNIGSLYSAQTGTPNVQNTGSALSRVFSDIGGIQHNPGKNYKVVVSLTDSTGSSLYPYITDDSDSLFTINEASVMLTAASSNQSSTSGISVNIGDKFTISGTPQGLQGMTYGSGPGQFTMSYNFVQTFSNDNNCGNNEATSTGPWIMTCTAQVPGSSTFYVAINMNGQEVYRSNIVTVTIKQSTSTDLCPNISGVQTSIPVGMIKDSSGNCVAGGVSTPTTATCVQTGTGAESISLKSYTTPIVSKGSKNVLLASIDIKNIGQTDICNINGLQLGSNGDTSSILQNIRTSVSGLNTQYLISNGSYYYHWISPITLPLRKGTSTTVNIYGDIKLTAPDGTFQVGMFGINHDLPGAYSSGLPVLGNPITLGGILNPRTNTTVSVD